jgi:hypothetical protein
MLPGFRVASVGLVLISVAGCGGASKVEVTGNVTYQGKPIEEGRIRFEPVEKLIAPEGAVIRDGVYHVKLPLGLAKVGITGVRKKEQKLDSKANGPTRPIYEELVPKKYNDEPEITAEIKADTNRLDFDLK